MSPADYFIFVLFMALGCFSLVAALFNFEWYFQTSAALNFVRWFGRRGARWFYALLGLLLILCGALGMIYW